MDSTLHPSLLFMRHHVCYACIHQPFFGTLQVWFGTDKNYMKKDRSGIIVEQIHNWRRRLHTASKYMQPRAF